MKIVQSTYHQLVRYPTLAGMSDIRGDQVTVRTIFVVAQKKLGWKLRTAKAVPEESLPEKKLKQLVVE